MYAKFLQEKIGLVYPINDQLQKLLGETLSDSRWDMPYLGMQVLIEGLALAAFGLMRDMTTMPLPKQILAYVMQDEARHVAFGRLALRDYYKQITEAERREREEFVIEGCYLMRDRIRSDEIWETFGIPVKEIKRIIDDSAYMRMFRSLLFSRIVPCVRDIGLWSERVQQAYDDMGVLDMARQDLEVLMSQDEDIAEQLDRERFAAEESARKAEVDDVNIDRRLLTPHRLTIRAAHDHEKGAEVIASAVTRPRHGRHNPRQAKLQPPLPTQTRRPSQTRKPRGPLTLVMLLLPVPAETLS